MARYNLCHAALPKGMYHAGRVLGCVFVCYGRCVAPTVQDPRVPRAHEVSCVSTFDDCPHTNAVSCALHTSPPLDPPQPSSRVCAPFRACAVASLDRFPNARTAREESIRRHWEAHAAPGASRGQRQGGDVRLATSCDAFQRRMQCQRYSGHVTHPV